MGRCCCFWRCWSAVFGCVYGGTSHVKIQSLWTPNTVNCVSTKCCRTELNICSSLSRCSLKDCAPNALNLCQVRWQIALIWVHRTKLDIFQLWSIKWIVWTPSKQAPAPHTHPGICLGFGFRLGFRLGHRLRFQTKLVNAPSEVRLSLPSEQPPLKGRSNPLHPPLKASSHLFPPFESYRYPLPLSVLNVHLLNLMELYIVSTQSSPTFLALTGLELRATLYCSE